MWRGAHGRLAAIVVLAGGLSSCLPEPRRPPPLEVALANSGGDDDEERTPKMHCGFQHFDGRSGAEMKRDLENDLPQLIRNCRLSPEDQKYGEVRVTWSQKYSLAVDLSRTYGLTEDDRRCVEDAVRTAAPRESGEMLRSADTWAKQLPDGLTVYTSFGTPPPLLPPMPDFAAEWQAAITSPQARERLRSKLPEETVLEDDGCISFPYRPAFRDRLQRWLESAGARPDAFWNRGVTHRGLFTGMGVIGQPDAHAYVLANKSVILEGVHWPLRPRFANAGGQEVCLVPWDGKLQRELRTRIDQRASCMNGDLGEILLHPRTGVPTGRPFQSVAVGPTRVCALDGAGRLSCCGERTQQDIPAAAFTSVAVGTNFDCGVTVAGDLYCWGNQSPAYGTVIRGPFAEVSLASGVCAIRRDTRALECWDPDVGRMVTATKEKVRGVAGGGGEICVLLEAGPVLCGDSHPGSRW